MTGTAKRTSRAMLALSAALLMGGAAPVLVPGSTAQAQEYQDEGPFDQLEQYGDWVNHWKYGRVWYPRDVDEDWRPYTRGRWELTDQYGWYWESDEPWGWATYHYGRWAFDNDYGWIWIPGDQWGPAWVDWRQDDETIGWAPLPPEVGWGGDGLAFADVDLDSEAYRPTWTFVPIGRFHDRDWYRYSAPPSRNFQFLRRTERVTRYERGPQGVFNRSIDPGRIAAFTHHDIRPVPVNPVGRPPAARPDGGSGRAIGVFRPDFHGRPPQGNPQVNAPRPVPNLPQGGFSRQQGGPPQGGQPQIDQRKSNGGPQPDQGRWQGLQNRQADEARRLQDMQARERAGEQAARDADMARRHQMEQQEQQRIQQQQRAVQQNREQFQQSQPQHQFRMAPQQAQPQPQQQPKVFQPQAQPQPQQGQQQRPQGQPQKPGDQHQPGQPGQPGGPPGGPPR